MICKQLYDFKYLFYINNDYNLFAHIYTLTQIIVELNGFKHVEVRVI